jgi:uncharacterized surface protein with fasciclin (FAS1) repeats
MAALNPSHRSRWSIVLPMLAATTLFAATACGSDDSADDAVLDVDSAEVDDLVDSAAAEVDATRDDLAQTLRDNGLDSIAGVVEQVDVSQWLGEGEFTFFAPSNEAFMGLDAEQTADLLTDPARIAEVLRNHTLADTVPAAELVTLQTVDTEAGGTLAVTTVEEEVRLDGVAVVSTDIEVANGVIHVVDGLLLP